MANFPKQTLLLKAVVEVAGEMQRNSQRNVPTETTERQTAVVASTVRGF